jgi:hypothetical protein
MSLNTGDRWSAVHAMAVERYRLPPELVGRTRLRRIRGAGYVPLSGYLSPLYAPSMQLELHLTGLYGGGNRALQIEADDEVDAGLEKCDNMPPMSSQEFEELLLNTLEECGVGS